MAKFLITLLFGWLGIHKFMDRKIVMGIVYLCTLGLFGVGWLIDTVKAWKSYSQAKKSTEIKEATPVAPTVQRHNEDTPKLANPVAHNDCFMGMDAIRLYEKSFIAFDVETTGFDAATDKIVELSAVLFEDLRPTRTFSTLIQPGRPMPTAASKVNGITDEMLKNAPSETDAIRKFTEFVGAVTLAGDQLLVAHNATFDIKFLLYAFARCGIDADLSFVDTLSLSREVFPDAENHKLGTMAKHLGIDLFNAHRAEDDARVCGELFVRILQHKKTAFCERLNDLNPLERDLCLWYRNLIENADMSTQLLYFHSGSTYLTANCVYTALKAKPKAKHPYVLIEGGVTLPEGVQTAPATKSEGEDKLRVFFSQPNDLDPIADILLRQYTAAHDSGTKYLSGSDRYMKEYAKTLSAEICV